MPLNEKKHSGPKYSPFSKEFYIFYKNMSEEDAIKEAKSKRPCNIEYWIKKGYTEEEANQKRLEFQISNGNKFSKKNKDNPELYNARSPTQIQYWIKKGYTEEEAKQKVHERQQTFSKKIMIEKYGEDIGMKKWKERQNKWINTLSQKSQEEKNIINSKKSISIKNLLRKYGDEKIALTVYENWFRKILLFSKISVSKESTLFFDKLKEKYSNLSFKYGIGNELYLFDDDNNCFFYDCFIDEIKLIIEYNGIMFHPNKNKLCESEFKKWKQLYSNLSAEEVEKKDLHKKNIALQNGYNIIEIWSDDDEKLKTAFQYIDNLLCKQK